MGKTTETLEFLINANASSAIKAFKDVGDSADQHLTKAQTRSDQVSANLTKFGAGAVAVAGIVGAGLVKLGSDFDDAFDKIRTQTGATGKTLEGLQGDFKATLSEVPNSMDEVSTAIGALNQKLGLTGKPLQDLSAQFLNLSRITGTDLTKDIEGATGLFNQFGITADQQGGKLDELFRITQATGVGFETLTTQLAQNGSVFRAAGLSFDESASLLGLLAKNGLDASNVVPALAKSMATAAKEGKPAAEVFRETFDAIKAAPTDTAAAGIALDVFGAKAGPKFAELVRQGTLSYDDFTAAIGNSGDTINSAAADTNDFAENLDLLKNKVMVALEPALSSAFDTMTVVVDKLGAAFDALPAPVVGIIGDVALFGTAALGVVGAVSLVVGQVGKLVDVAKGAGSAIGGLARFIGSVGPEAVIAGGALVGLGAILAINSSEHALATARTKEYVQALKDEAAGTKGAVEGLIAQKITSNDVADTAKRLGLSVKDVADIITGKSVPAYDALRDKIQKIDDTGQQSSQTNAKLITDYGNLKGTIQDQSVAYQNAIKQSADLAEANKALGITTTDDATSTAAAAKASADKAVTDTAAIETTKALTAEANAHAQAVKDELQALTDAAKAQQAQVDAQRAAADASVGLGKAEDEQATFLAGLSQQITDAKGNQQQLNDINRDAVDKTKAVADATNQLAAQQAAAAGSTVSATQKIDTWNGSMLTSAAHLTGPVQQAVLGYIAATNGIPPEKLTDVRALLDQGKIAEAEAALNAVSRARAVAVSADTSGAQANLQAVIDKMNQIRDKTVHVNAVGNVNVNGAASGGLRAGLTMVGEQGPELVVLPSGSYVHTASETAGMMSGGQGGVAIGAALVGSAPGASNITINVVAGWGADGAAISDEIVKQLKIYERRNGNVPVKTL